MKNVTKDCVKVYCIFHAAYMGKNSKIIEAIYGVPQITTLAELLENALAVF